MSQSKSAATTAQTAYSRSQARAYAPRKTGPRLTPASREPGVSHMISFVDARGIASCAPIVETRFPSYPQTRRMRTTADLSSPAQSASPPSSFIVISADGTLQRSTSRSKSRQASPVSHSRFFSFFLSLLKGPFRKSNVSRSQLNYKSSRTLRRTRSNSNALKSTLSHSYVHPLPPPALLATHTRRTRMPRRSTPSQLRHRLHWRATFQGLESTPLLHAVGATRARGMRFPSTAVGWRLEAQRTPPT